VNASSYDTEKSFDEKKVSMAESDFIHQCCHLNKICMEKILNLKDCIPEIILLDQSYSMIASGLKDGYIVNHLIQGADYITKVLGTEYYLVNIEIPLSILKILSK
jgi:hypothetical protein